MVETLDLPINWFDYFEREKKETMQLWQNSCLLPGI
jgi:hypothetical protein